MEYNLKLFASLSLNNKKVIMLLLKLINTNMFKTDDK